MSFLPGSQIRYRGCGAKPCCCTFNGEIGTVIDWKQKSGCPDFFRDGLEKGELVTILFEHDCFFGMWPPFWVVLTKECEAI